MDSKKLTDSVIDDTFKALNERHSDIYRFVMRYNDYIYSTHNYGEDIPLTMIEVHTLTYIDDHPGATSSELIRFWSKTKGTISQIVSRLESYDLIEKRKENGNAKNLHLYVTESGARLSKAHKLYDTIDIAKTMSELREECTAEDIESFYKVLAVYNKIISNDFEINQGKPRRKK